MRVSPGYFTTLRTPLVEGRLFDERDGEATPVAVINEWMARRYMREASAVGGRVLLNDEWVSVVGVVADIRHRTVQRAGPQIYLPYAGGFRGDMAVVVRTEGSPTALVPTVRRLIASIDPEVMVYGALPLEERLSSSVAEPRFRLLLLGAFRLASLLLSAIGVYGVMAYAVARRYLYGLAPWDPLGFTLASTVIVGAAILACWIPARRASRIDQMAALRLA